MTLDIVIFFLVVSFLLAGMFVLAVDEFEISKSFFQKSTLEQNLREIIHLAEMLPSGSIGQLTLTVPSGMSNITVRQVDEYWMLGFCFKGKCYEKPSDVKILFVPEDLLERAGSHRVIIQKESEKGAVVKAL